VVLVGSVIGGPDVIEKRVDEEAAGAGPSWDLWICQRRGARGAGGQGDEEQNRHDGEGCGSDSLRKAGFASGALAACRRRRLPIWTIEPSWILFDDIATRPQRHPNRHFSSVRLRM
jgi:hypothetical protein